MKKLSETIVFFGSGPVAAKSLRLLGESFEIEVVITKPSTAEEMQAAAPDTPILLVENKNELNDLLASSSFTSRLSILIDFGIIVSQDVIDYFPLGIINSHFSLLPEWRGADPISFAILSGQPKTGVSLMLIDAGMDTGKLLAQKSLQIKPEETTPELTDRLIGLSYTMLRTHLPAYVSGKLRPRSQPHPDRATYSRKLTKEDGIIDWEKPAEQLEREIRAFVEWPKSRSEVAGKEVVITKARVVPEPGAPGNTEVRNKELLVFCAEGALLIEKLKPAGKKEMNAQAFINGYMKR
jgi:methionyl-tRNA formyltransferase